MTDETRKRLPDIIERIDKLASEVKEIHKAEVKELRERYDEMDLAAQLDAECKTAHLRGVYGLLYDASKVLTNY